MEKQCPNGHYYKEELENCPYCDMDKQLEELGKKPSSSRPPSDMACCYCPAWISPKPPKPPKKRKGTWGYILIIVGLIIVLLFVLKKCIA